jgi:MFS family permease
MTSAFRALSGGAILTGLVLAFSGSHLVIGLVGSLPLLARSGQLLVPRLVARHGGWRITRAAALVERLGFLAAAAVGLLRPPHALALLLVFIALGTIAASVYDCALTAMATDRVRGADQGRYFGIRMRWSSGMGVLAGILAGVGLDAVEGAGMLPANARSIALLAGMLPAAFAILALRRFDAMPHIADERLPAPTPTGAAEISERVQRLTTGSFPVIRARGSRSLRRFFERRAENRPLRALLGFAVIWGFATGLLARHLDAFAMSVLGYSVGTLTVIAGLIAGAGAVGAKTWGRLGDRYGAKPILVLATFVIALNPLWYAMSTKSYAWPYVAGQILAGAANAGWVIGIPLLLLNAPLRRAGEKMRMFALFHATAGLAAGVGPMVGGWMLTLLAPIGEHTAYVLLFAFSSVLRLGAVWMLVRLPDTERGGARHLMKVMWRRMRMNVRGVRGVGEAA